MSRYVIGLTGGIACGKSNLSGALKGAGARVIDADAISRSLTAEGGRALPTIRAAFGDGVFAGDALDRRALARLIFGNEEKRQALNAILHPLVLSAIREEMEKAQGPVILDVPLLFETGMDDWCDEIWCAYVPQKEQVRRIMARDHVTRKEALDRIHAQMPNREKMKKSHRVIRTDGSREMSAQIVLSLWQSILEKGETLA